MADIAKLETFNAAFGKIAQAKKLLDDALVQLDIFVHANQTNTDAQEYFDINKRRLTKSVPPAYACLSQKKILPQHMKL